MKKTSSNSEYDVYLETVHDRRRQVNKGVASARNKKQRFDLNTPRGRFDAFMHQEIEPSGFGLIPKGYEGITYFVLFLFVPQLTGMGFFFFYVGHASFDLFSKAHTGGFFLDWMIGYEILTTLALLIIGIKLLGYMFDP